MVVIVIVTVSSTSIIHLHVSQTVGPLVRNLIQKSLLDVTIAYASVPRTVSVKVSVQIKGKWLALCRVPLIVLASVKIGLLNVQNTIQIPVRLTAGLKGNQRELNRLMAVLSVIVNALPLMQLSAIPNAAKRKWCQQEAPWTKRVGVKYVIVSVSHTIHSSVKLTVSIRGYFLQDLKFLTMVVRSVIAKHVLFMMNRPARQSVRQRA